MADPYSKELDLFGDTYDLSLNAGKLRLAEMKGEGVNKDDIEKMSDFTFGCRLAYIAMVPDLPEDKTEEDVIRALTEKGDCNEVATYCLKQYMEMQSELGKSLEGMVEEMQTTNSEMVSSTSTP